MPKVKFETMKQNILKNVKGLSLSCVATLFLAINSAFAVPAKPGVRAVRQPDGSVINIELRGDEHFNWRTTESGHAVARGEDGYYYYARYSQWGELQPTAQRVVVDGRVVAPASEVASQDITQIATRVRGARRAKRQSVMSKAKAFPSHGTIKAVIILVEYKDVKFTVADPNKAFHNQLNQEGYSVNGATGSARDYYAANSNGAFDGQFDVYGPYTLENDRSYYGGNDRDGSDLRPNDMVREAVEIADSQGVDFSQYDVDGDGYIDNVFVYYAGHNEAESSKEDCVWPHMWVVYDRPLIDGKTLYSYACTSELTGASGATIAGIGTFCHEFGHVFGLYDHYDTDYTENGYSYGVGAFDIMCDGSYNNEGRTPPLFNALEVNTIGWYESQVLRSSQSITLKPIQHQQSYKILTENEGEYFLLENRNSSSIIWDKYIPASGLLIYHVDESAEMWEKWQYNSPNSDPSHECFKLVVAGNVGVNSYNWSKVPYPYRDNNEWSATSRPAAVSWAGVPIDVSIVDIERSGSEDITFKSIVEGSDNVIVSRLDGLEDSFVGDIIPLKADIYPAVGGANIKWSSSDIDVAQVSQDGEVKLVGSGQVTIKAIYINDADQELEGSISFTVSQLQGARGVISSNDGKPLSGVKIFFYPTSDGDDDEPIRTTRILETSVSALTDAKGAYRVALEPGIYEVDITAERYAEHLEIVEIGIDTTTLDFSLSSYSSLVRTIRVEPYQEEALVEWNPGGYKYFSIEVSGAGDKIKPIVTNDCRYELTGLTSESSYMVTVSCSNDGEDYMLLYTTEFTTLGKLTSMPMIRLSSYDFSENEVIELRTLNTTSKDKTVWYVNSEKQPRTKIVLPVGEHMIQADVTRGNTTYRVTRFINVK